MDEVAGHGKATGHVRGVALVLGNCGDDVPGDLLLRRQNRYMGKVTKSITT